MKRIFSNILAGIAVAAGAVLTPGCSDDLLYDDKGGEMVNVCFTLLPEAASTSTRADGAAADSRTISDGSGVDMIIYAVYDSEDNLLTEFSRGVDPELAKLGFDHGDGQTVKRVDKFPYELNLTMRRGVTYKVAFWAQSSKSRVYNTSDLRKVEVIYGRNQVSTGDDKYEYVNTLNNDEDRDVFCRSTVIIPSNTTGKAEQNVYLYRPLAQINVGTSGFDYEITSRNTSRKYLYSRIRINRAARYLDLVNDRIYSTTTDENETTPESFAVVDYDYAPIPAYQFFDRIPDDSSYSMWDWVYSPGTPKGDGTLDKNSYDGEQFLKVKVKGDSKTSSIANWTGDIDSDGYCDYANFDSRNNYGSETFKYLSMCYILSNSTKDEGEVLNNIKVWIATDADGSDEIAVIDLNHVPVQRNWRTNIVGNLLTEENTFSVSLDRNFAGDYDAWKADDNWEWSGPLAKGVYYDAAADEIQISDVDGLLWFQRMVNGDLKKRETAERYWNKYVGDYYWYNDGSGDKQLVYKGIDPPADRRLKLRILKATHQDRNTNVNNYDTKDPDGWPVGNRFHFIGYNKDANGKSIEDRAKVKLMADIDLSGIEWIPIGFEGKIVDQMQYQGYDSGGMSSSFKQASASNTFSAKNSNPHVRGFWGEFDGNNHTISNLTTKRFGIKVMDWEPERGTSFTAAAPDKREFNTSFRFTDTPPWLARGLFGQVFANAKIRNVRLLNVDIKGCNGVGGIVGVALGDNIEITNCVVDGGTIVNTPMYRGDMTNINSNDDIRNRTFARGIYTGGIVGCFNTIGGKVENCQVNNLTIQGYRRLGGLIGSVDLAENIDGDVNVANSRSLPASISNNSVSNTTIIGTSYTPFSLVYAQYNNTKKMEWTGFAYVGADYHLNVQRFVGGDSRDYVDKSSSTKCTGNYADNITFAEMRIDWDKDDTGLRTSNIEKVSLNLMPLLSSWYVDEISLNENYYGSGMAKKVQTLHPFYHNSYDKDGQFYYPIELPTDVDITWAPNQTANIGLYVESVNIKGNGVGNRSVITPDNVRSKGSAVMFVTSRDHKAYFDALNVNTGTQWYKKDTKITNFVLRGSPYAYTGLLISPNENMKSVQLDNVAIYDVYQTIALDDAYISGKTYWPNKKPDASGVQLIVRNSNLRGYTVPGPGWNLISYTGTTFEAGVSTGHGDDELTCKVEARTTFNRCFFKAPYIVDLSAAPAGVTFTNCQATSTGKSKTIAVPPGCAYFKVTSNKDGEAVVTYYDAYDHPIH